MREQPAGQRSMKRATPVVSFLLLLLAISIMSSVVSVLVVDKEEDEIEISGDDEGEIEISGDGVTAVHIVYVDRPEGEEPEAFHIRTLASVVGSEEAAKDAVVYHYKHAASGFSAKLTPKQVSDLSQKPEVLQVVPSRTVQLCGPGGGGIRPGVM